MAISDNTVVSVLVLLITILILLVSIAETQFGAGWKLNMKGNDTLTNLTECVWVKVICLIMKIFYMI